MSISTGSNPLSSRPNERFTDGVRAPSPPAQRPQPQMEPARPKHPVPPNTFNVGDKVQRHGGKRVMQITELNPNGQDVYTDGSGNPWHYLDLHPVGSRPKLLVDKAGNTAGEKAAQQYPVGSNAIYTVMGDFWVTITEVRPNGHVFAKIHPEADPYEFRPELFHGEWTWYKTGGQYYTLRPRDGYFHEYSD